jgi:NAD(P)-dependent dehydrogenase (short-subunit alcohol dehydrogenase family)
MKLKGKWALVTGSSRGIGQQIALGLAAEGCNVIVHGRQLENTVKTLDLLSNYNVESLAVEGDLSMPDGASKVIESVIEKVGDIDILYNNAAISTQSKPIWDFTIEEWQKLFQVNVYSLIGLCNAFAPRMKERGYGRIINLSSGIKNQPELAPYGVSKGTVDRFTIDLAYALKDTNVRVNYLDPGWIRTDLGGPNGSHDVTAVLPGALVPALLDDKGPTGEFFKAQAYRVDK